MLQSEICLPSTNLSHSSKELKELILSLAKEPKFKIFSPLLRSTANQIRIQSEGYNRKVTINKIIKLLQEFEQCEIIDFVDETGIDEKEIKAALAELVASGKIGTRQRRRWQEAGKHYNDIYYLN